jgi:hypothetical protein
MKTDDQFDNIPTYEDDILDEINNHSVSKSNFLSSSENPYKKRGDQSVESLEVNSRERSAKLDLSRNGGQFVQSLYNQLFFNKNQ